MSLRTLITKPSGVEALVALTIAAGEAHITFY